MSAFDPADYADWIGRGFQRVDRVTPAMVARWQAVLDGLLAEAAVPMGLFWGLCPDVLPPERLGRDGHPKLGIYLPDLPLPRRMWAGGALTFSGRLAPGDDVVRQTEITDIHSKTGASGPLGFVTVRHRYRVAGATVIDERQDLVYRADPGPGAGASSAAPPLAPDLGAPLAQLRLTPDPVLLYRFSALTFNGHRIHYDTPYAREVEGYDGLLVHGPLQALLMLNLATRILGDVPARFDYRGRAPLVVGREIIVEGHGAAEGGLDLRVRVVDGPVTMTAVACGSVSG